MRVVWCYHLVSLILKNKKTNFHYDSDMNRYTLKTHLKVKRCSLEIYLKRIISSIFGAPKNIKIENLLKIYHLGSTVTSPIFIMVKLTSLYLSPGTSDVT